MSLQPVVHPSPRPSHRDVQNINTIFPAGKNPPIRPNTDLCCNQLALCPPGLPKAHSTLIRETWDKFLTSYPDCEFVSSLLNIIDVGASIGHSGPPISQSCKNFKSAMDYSVVISKEIDSLLLEGHIHGPFTKPPSPNFRCSPLGTSSHKCNPKQHVFNHYSWPITGSVNDETPDTEGTIHYDSFTSMATVLHD